MLSSSETAHKGDNHDGRNYVWLILITYIMKCLVARTNFEGNITNECILRAKFFLDRFVEH